MSTINFIGAVNNSKDILRDPRFSYHNKNVKTNSSISINKKTNTPVTVSKNISTSVSITKNMSSGVSVSKSTNSNITINKSLNSSPTYITDMNTSRLINPSNYNIIKLNMHQPSFEPSTIYVKGSCGDC